MEKRLRQSLRSSAEDFLSIALILPPKSSKVSLRPIIHSISPSSDLVSTLPSATKSSISLCLQSFRIHGDPLSSPSKSSPPDLFVSPISKRARTRSQNKPLSTDGDKLIILTHIVSICLSHPKDAFQAADFFPAVRLLHDSLILFESLPNLSSEISLLCELFWKENFPGREALITQSLPYIISRSLTFHKKSDVHRAYTLREAFSLFDFEDESIEDLKMLLIRCVLSPAYLKNEEGKKFIGYVLGLSREVLKEGLEMIRSQMSFGRKSSLEAYGEIIFRIWKGVNEELKIELEDGFLMDLADGAIHASSRAFAGSIRRVLGGFVSQRVTDGVEKLLFRLSEPIIFRSLQAANSDVRLNSLHLFLDLFPLDDPDATKEVKDTLFEKQFFLLERLLMDECPDIRSIAVEGCCRILHLFWEIIPVTYITKFLTKMFDDMSHDVSNAVRLSTLNGVAFLVDNPQSHEILKVLLPRLGHLIMDSNFLNRVALVNVLRKANGINNFTFEKIVPLDDLCMVLADEDSQVAKKITGLLMPLFFPSKLGVNDNGDACVAQFMRFPSAGSRFCEFAASEGASLKSLLVLFEALIKSVLSGRMVVDQIEGFLLAAAYLCNSLWEEEAFKSSMKEILLESNFKSLFAIATTNRARSSVLNIVSRVSPENANLAFEDCMRVVVNCSGLSEKVEMQNEVRAAHKLLISFAHFDDMFEIWAESLQKAAYRCHVKFGISLPNPKSSSRRRQSSSLIKSFSKWRNLGGKKKPTLEEDFSIAVGISWQIYDFLSSEDTRELILNSQGLEPLFNSLKVISEISIRNCSDDTYMDSSPVLAYTSLALHIAVENIHFGRSEDTISLDRTADHLIVCIETLLDGEQIPATDSSTLASKLSPRNGRTLIEETRVSRVINVLTLALKFIVDSVVMGFLSGMAGRCLHFTTACTKHLNMKLRLMSEGVKILCDDDEQRGFLACLKCFFSYEAKLLNAILGNSEGEETSHAEAAFLLANEMLTLISIVETSFAVHSALRFTSAVKYWLPDLILSLGSVFLSREPSADSVLNLLKQKLPYWLSVLANCENREVQEDDVDNADGDKLDAFGKFMEMIVSFLRGSVQVQDAIGLVLLVSAFAGLEAGHIQLALGLLKFINGKLLGSDNKTWNEHTMMLSYLPQVYMPIENEIEKSEDEGTRSLLASAKSVLEPVWLYHVYESGKFSMAE